ncbi:MAG: 2-C-methyl-D-erythritol 2,4-cyclodiphosphate synthase [Firmicutes bacterium]|nr:2-C-methyl-D-erythritol 2,4-cyclodiphosphate synthase [Bacillota bacterium]
MYEKKKVTAVIVAAGSGTRMGTDVPKQFLKIGGRTILETTVAVFEKNPYVDDILVLTGRDFVEFCEELCRPFEKVRSILPGGKERQDTVWEAVRRISDGELVLIHDGVRPYVTDAVIEGVLAGAKSAGAAVPAVASKDTVRQTAAEGGSRTLDRKTLFQVQTPQGFASEILREAYEAAYRDGFLGTDDAGLAERIGQTILLTEGDYANIKITTREDLPMEIRVGTGYDVHRLTEGRKLILGGVDIPYEKGLDGHSDADVMVHALMDALLGAAGLGDIGRHFPDTDPQYKGISSLKLLEIVNQRIHEAGYELGNADVTIIAQRPKLAGYISQMEENLAAVLGADMRQINVKATTTEKLGFTGRGEGIAAEAACIIKSKH